MIILGWYMRGRILTCQRKKSVFNRTKWSMLTWNKFSWWSLVLASHLRKWFLEGIKYTYYGILYCFIDFRLSYTHIPKYLVAWFVFQFYLTLKPSKKTFYLMAYCTHILVSISCFVGITAFKLIICDCTYEMSGWSYYHNKFEVESHLATHSSKGEKCIIRLKPSS